MTQESARTLLIIDDESDFYGPLKQNLEREGYQVMTGVENYAQFLLWLEQYEEPPELALVDLLLSYGPQKDVQSLPGQGFAGLKVLEILGSRGIRSIVISGYVDQKEEDIAKQSKAVFWVFDKGQLGTNAGRDLLFGKIKAALEEVDADRYAEGKAPEQFARLQQLPRE